MSFVVSCLRVQPDKGHQEEENIQQKIILSEKEIQRTFQRNYPYQEKGQRS